MEILCNLLVVAFHLVSCSACTGHVVDYIEWVGVSIVIHNTAVVSQWHMDNP